MPKTTVLLVDDDRLILAMLGSGLRHADYDVLEASSGEEALRICEARQPELAVLDVRMPGLSGVDTARAMRERSAVPFVFLSAYGDLDTVRQAAGEGALGYLLKPVDLPQILPSIETALVRAAELRRLRAAESHLNETLNRNRSVSLAIGVIMERHRLSQAEAFEVLRFFARSHRRKISEVAAEVVRAVDTINLPRSAQ
ncbi:MAG: response regulator [Gammaproteobacteria bacterium]|nr:response regulator [Gammaproteobacteria bacterium]